MKSIPLFAALLLNAAIAALELFVLGKLTRKEELFKYYTYLANLIAWIAGVVFVISAACCLLQAAALPLWVKGIRFCASFMLCTTLFVYFFVLRPMDKSQNTITAEDFTGISPEFANFVLHVLCPALSAVSFVFLERQPVLTDPAWTLRAAIPTILYWTVYLILTAAKLWEDPYGFSRPNKSRSAAGAVMGLLIPAVSVGLDFLLWWLNTLNF